MGLSKEYFIRRLLYDQDTGFMYRLDGKRADHFQGKYRRVNIDGMKLYVHHIAWCMHYNEWPDQLDHINGDCEDNRIENLRKSTQTQNMANAHLGSRRGVEQHGRKWRARVWYQRTRFEFGSYDTKEEALEAYKKGAEELFGEFAFHNRPE